MGKSWESSILFAKAIDEKAGKTGTQIITVRGSRVRRTRRDHFSESIRQIFTRIVQSLIENTLHAQTSTQRSFYIVALIASFADDQANACSGIGCRK